MSSSSTGIASSTGLISGIDYDTLISKLISADSQPIYQAQSKESTINTKKSAMQGINKLLLTFESAVEDLNDDDSFIVKSATCSDTDYLSVSTDDDAEVGSYSVKICQMAQAARIASQGFETMDTTSIASAEGTFSFSVGEDETTSINVTSGMSLVDLRDAINNADAGVRASIISDGTQTNAYRLVLTCTSSGAANTLTIEQNDTSVNLSSTSIEAAAADSDNQFDGTVTSSGTYTGTTTRNAIARITSAGDVGTAKYQVSLDGGLTWSAADAFTTSADAVDITGTAAEGINIAFGAGTTQFAVGDTFTIDAFAPVLQKAQDAIIQVDGIQVNRATNSFDDVVPGLTLTAKKVSDEAVRVTVSNQNSSIVSKVQAFVSAYNGLVKEIATQTAYDTDSQTAAALFGDSSLNNLVSQMRSAIAKNVKGLSGDYTSLSSIGISFAKDGSLELDSSKLTDALEADADAVKELFVEAGNSASSSVTMASTSSKTQVGTYSVSITSPATQATVTGTQVVPTSGIGASETLRFAYGEESMNVTLTAGMTLAQIISKLNTQFENNGYALKATDNGGCLQIHTTDYGSAETFTLSSTVDAGTSGQLGIGRSTITATGTDVEGEIGGIKATGKGQTLTASSVGKAAGLVLNITATAPMTTSITVSRGAAWDLLDQIDALTDSETGLFAVREETYNQQIKDLDKQIETLQSRLETEEENLRTKFTNLETKLASLQQQSNSLQSALSSLISSSSSS